MATSSTAPPPPPAPVTTLSTIDTGHEDIIHDSQLDFYGKRLATCSSDHSVRIFRILADGSHQLLAKLNRHEGPVWQVAWGHPKFGSTLATCSYDRRVLFWQEKDDHSWEVMHEYRGHTSSVNSIDFSPPEWEFTLACASSDGTISIVSHSSTGEWVDKKIPNAHDIGCNSVSWAPAHSPQMLAPGMTADPAPVRFVSGGCDNLVKIWQRDEIGEWKTVQVLGKHSGWVRSVAWAPATGLVEEVIASGGQDLNVIVWKRPFENGEWAATVINTFDDMVWHVSWSLMGNILAVSNGDNKVSLWHEGTDQMWDCINADVHGTAEPVQTPTNQEAN